MANRDYKFIRFLERVVVGMTWDITIGATGAPTKTVNTDGTSRNLGLTSITRASAGVYNLVLDDNFSRNLYFDITQIGASQDLTFQVTTDYANGTQPAGGTISFTCKTANAATDPTNGTFLRIVSLWKNSSVP